MQSIKINDEAIVFLVEEDDIKMLVGVELSEGEFVVNRLQDVDVLVDVNDGFIHAGFDRPGKNGLFPFRGNVSSFEEVVEILQKKGVRFL